jgi:uncharacterized damage-inducible protein DinB
VKLYNRDCFKEEPAMINRETARALAEYKAWADKRTFDAVSALPGGELRRERQTLFKTIIATMNHSYVVDLIWQAHLEGRPHGFSARNPVLHEELASLRHAQQQYNDWLCGWSAGQTEARLLETIRFKFISGEDGAMSRGAMLLHIVNHATYHRGWVSDLFFQVPATPPTTDLCVFPGVNRSAGT